MIRCFLVFSDARCIGVAARSVSRHTENMCYSALAWADYNRYTREFGATVSMRDFAKMYGYKPIRKRRRAKAMDEAIRRGFSDEERAISEILIEAQREDLIEWQTALFAQRKRLADGERVLAGPKPTKKAANDVRVASNKIEQFRRWISDAERREVAPSDSRIYPWYFIPVMVWEEGRRVVKPMRFKLRMQGWTQKVDEEYDGTFNARRDALETKWSKHWGKKHAVIVINSFYEHVWKHNAEGRPLAEGEEPEDVVIQFRPDTGHDMILACLYSDWGDEPGELLSFAFVTDDPPPEVAATGHDRCVMPIRRENIDEWLQAGDKTRMQAILDDRERPYYEHRLAA